MSNPIPSPPTGSYWTADPVFQTILRARVPDASWGWVESLGSRFGDLAAAQVAPLAGPADRCGPRLVNFDARGERIDEIEYHPAYRQMERLAYGNGIIAEKYHPGNRREHGRAIHLAGFAMGYLFGQAECGLFCPICMTDGAARVIERHASRELVETYVPRLASRDPETVFQGAMFLTEKQGGSDVGATQTRAVQEMDGTWRLHGDKWFCSKVDADVILALARPEGAGDGTRGLGLFLVPRRLPGGGGNNLIRIHRIKEKLGVRSMPTGEVTLSGSVGFLIGGPGEGFKQMAEMLNMSRLYNSVAAVSVMRRALVEAIDYARGRRSFGRPLLEHPLHRTVLADWVGRHWGALLLVFETVKALDDADAGDADALRLVRLLTPIGKAFTGKLAVAAVSECMEAIGGNAYIEESPLPRLLRDAQVLPIWEGTTNILSLDLLRVLEGGGGSGAYDGRVQRALDGAKRTAPAAAIDAVARSFDATRSGRAAIRGGAREGAERSARRSLNAMATTLQAALALEDEGTVPAVRAILGEETSPADEELLLERALPR